MIHFPVRRFDYPDQEIANDIARGTPIAAGIHTRPNFRRREKPAAIPTDAWSKGISGRNARTVGRVQRFREADLRTDFWRKYILVVEPGGLTKHIPPTDSGAESVNLTPMYAIYDQRGNGARKARIVDDMKAPWVDVVPETSDTAGPGSREIFEAISPRYRLIQPGRDVRAASSDFCHAYRNVGIPRDEGESPTVLLGPPTRPLLVSQIRTNPRGITRAPANLERVAALIQWILIAYFGAYVPI